MTTQTEDTNMADETMGVDTKRLRELALAVTHGREAVAREFTMRVPAEPQRDADLVLMSAADELDRLRTELATLREQLETERIRLAACGVVAMSNTPESAAKAREMLPIYWSASCGDVEKAVDREMALRTELASARVNEARYLWLRSGSWGGSGAYYFKGPRYSGDMCLDQAIDAALSQVQP